MTEGTCQRVTLSRLFASQPPAATAPTVTAATNSPAASHRAFRFPDVTRATTYRIVGGYPANDTEIPLVTFPDAGAGKRLPSNVAFIPARPMPMGSRSCQRDWEPSCLD